MGVLAGSWGVLGREGVAIGEKGRFLLNKPRWGRANCAHAHGVPGGVKQRRPGSPQGRRRGQGRPRSPQEAPETLPRGPRRSPRGLQDPPQWAQDASKTAQYRSKLPQEHPKSSRPLSSATSCPTHSPNASRHTRTAADRYKCHLECLQKSQDPGSTELPE